ncbi:MAG TPA: hypothetical protein VGF55_10135 [Gemmataceae bacterium]|jgi:hypothetical protein
MSDTPQSNNASHTAGRRPQERRKKNIPVALDRRGQAGAAARRAREDLPERRRQVDPTTCERDYNDEEIIFMKSMDQYKRDNRRPFPTWSEVLEVLRALGYRKVAEPTALPGNTRPIDVPPKG